MRTVLLCIAALIIAGCKAQTPPTLNQEPPKKQTERFELKEISYKRQSRGGNSLITFDPKKIVIYNSNQKSESYSYSEKEWDHLQILVNKIKLNSLPALKAPTDKRLYDGAAASTLSIVMNKKSYTSSTFDDGYPPDEISELVFKLLSLEEEALNN